MVLYWTGTEAVLPWRSTIEGANGREAPQNLLWDKPHRVYPIWHICHSGISWHELMVFSLFSDGGDDGNKDNVTILIRFLGDSPWCLLLPGKWQPFFEFPLPFVWFKKDPMWSCTFRKQKTIGLKSSVPKSSNHIPKMSDAICCSSSSSRHDSRPNIHVQN
jgi:hypothetical protein